MRQLFRILFISYLFISCALSADEDPARGKLLVATDLVGGPAFEETVVLILRYDSSGSLGLVVNRPTEIGLDEALPEYGQFENYDGMLYFGGPVQLHTLRVLLNTSSPPADAVNIFGSVHLAPIAEELFEQRSDARVLRLYIGYAGWAPGQLEQELAEGSWRIIPATEGLVFSDDPATIWRELSPPEVHRVSL